MATPSEFGNSQFSFLDRKCRTWDIALTYAAAKRIDNSDFSELTDKPFAFSNGPGGSEENRRAFFDAMSNPSVCLAMIWAIVHPVARKTFEAAGWSASVGDGAESIEDQLQMEFMDGIDGPTRVAAMEMFWGAVSDFFPEHRTLLGELKRQLDRGQKKVTEKFLEMGTKIDQMMDQEIDRTMDGVLSAGMPGTLSGG